jgi:hypothetical protein
MGAAKSKSVSSPDAAISAGSITDLDAFKADLDTKVGAMNADLQAQLNASLEEDSTLTICRMHVSHFLQVLNLGIARGVYPASARTFFGLDANQEQLPPLNKENDVVQWALQIKSGDAARVTAGGAAMVNPTAAQVDAVYNTYKTKHDLQSETKDDYDDSQQAVAAMFEPGKTMVTDLWDQVEFFYRNQPDEPSKRRKCREWGVVYVSREKATITGNVTDAGTGNPLEGVNVTIAETGDTVQTLADGKYILKTNFTGEGTLEFSLAGFVTQTFPVDVPEGGTLTQDAGMVAV